MGKGDKKSRRGKIILGSYGVRRPRKKDKQEVKPVAEVQIKEPKKKESRETVEKEVKGASKEKPVFQTKERGC